MGCIGSSIDTENDAIYIKKQTDINAGVYIDGPPKYSEWAKHVAKPVKPVTTVKKQLYPVRSPRTNTMPRVDTNYIDKSLM